MITLDHIDELAHLRALLDSVKRVADEAHEYYVSLRDNVRLRYVVFITLRAVG
jgi:hypothetical protein